MTIEEIAFKEYENVGDEKLFPNHTDKDIWIAGFKEGYLLAQSKVNKFSSNTLLAESCPTCGHSPCMCRTPLGNFR